MAIKSFRDLRVWNAAMDLVEHVYAVTGQFPREEIFGITSQTRRAAVSVPCNLAEGHTREHRREYLQHVSVGQASLAELETLMEIAARLGYVSRPQCDPLMQDVGALGRQLYALRNALRKPPEGTPPRTKRFAPAPGPRPPAPKSERNHR